MKGFLLGLPRETFMGLGCLLAVLAVGASAEISPLGESADLAGDDLSGLHLSALPSAAEQMEGGGMFRTAARGEARSAAKKPEDAGEKREVQHALRAQIAAVATPEKPQIAADATREKPNAKADVASNKARKKEKPHAVGPALPHAHRARTSAQNQKKLGHHAKAEMKDTKTHRLRARRTAPHRPLVAPMEELTRNDERSALLAHQLKRVVKDLLAPPVELGEGAHIDPGAAANTALHALRMKEKHDMALLHADIKAEGAAKAAHAEGAVQELHAKEHTDKTKLATDQKAARHLELAAAALAGSKKTTVNQNVASREPSSSVHPLPNVAKSMGVITAAAKRQVELEETETQEAQSLLKTLKGKQGLITKQGLIERKTVLKDLRTHRRDDSLAESVMKMAKSQKRILDDWAHIHENQSGQQQNSDLGDVDHVAPASQLNEEQKAMQLEMRRIEKAEAKEAKSKQEKPRATQKVLSSAQQRNQSRHKNQKKLSQQVALKIRGSLQEIRDAATRIETDEEREIHRNNKQVRAL